MREIASNGICATCGRFMRVRSSRSSSCTNIACDMYAIPVSVSRSGYGSGPCHVCGELTHLTIPGLLHKVYACFDHMDVVPECRKSMTYADGEHEVWLHRVQLHKVTTKDIAVLESMSMDDF